MRDTIKKIVFEEFSKLTDLIEKDFAANYKRKVNNFLLSQMDENITASMVFVIFTIWSPLKKLWDWIIKHTRESNYFFP